MISVTSCGKLYLAGEYAVLTPGQPALIQAVPIHMQATIAGAEAFCLRSDLFDYAVDLTPDANYALIQETVVLFGDYLSSLGLSLEPIDLTITSDMARGGRKLGLGSSGSVVFLVLRAMAELHELDLSADLLFRLATAVLLKRGDLGSMGDVACIAYEDLVYYQSFDREQVADWLASRPLAEVLDLDWGYVIKPVKPALSYDFLVGWTGKPAISNDLIKQVKSAITEEFLTASRAGVELAYQAFETGDQVSLMASLDLLGQRLADLHPAILTPELADLVAASQGLSATAKSSGAGGGDCGIALVFDPVQTQELINRWEAAGLTVIYKENYHV